MAQQIFARIAQAVIARGKHGTRASCKAGCKCFECRVANSRYMADRKAAVAQGDVRGIVPATAAREHILSLARSGVGTRAIDDITGIGRSIVLGIKNGTRRNIRQHTERKILAVSPDAISGGTLIPAGSTWCRLNILLDAGYTKTQLAEWLGYKTKAIQIRKARVTAHTAMRVEKLFALQQAGKLRRSS